MATLSASNRIQPQTQQKALSSSFNNHSIPHMRPISNLCPTFNNNNPNSNNSLAQQKNLPLNLLNKNATGLIPSINNDSMCSIMMNRLYSKSNNQKTWNELTKSMKQCLLDKRPLANDQNERFQLQKCLDTMQKNIEVKSIQSMMERLETICRQLKLKFTCSNLSECFVYSDMYYVEIKFDQEKGKVVDCKIAHHTHEASTCNELIDVLGKGDFIEFTKHLEGLTAIYKIKCDKPVKEKAYLALYALEKDLEQLAEFQKNQINDINNLIHKSPAGVLEPRKGGHPMKLTFFVPPYDLIDLSNNTSLPLTVDVVIERKLGYSATISLEDSEQINRLQVQSLITVKKNDGKNLPHFLSISTMNSQSLPAYYVLRLTQPLPICLDLVHKIVKLTGIQRKEGELNSLISLLTKVLISNDQKGSTLQNCHSQAFYTVLPDQNHCYYVNNDEIVNGGLKGSNFSTFLSGILIETIPFTHPTHVSRILVYLRQQVLFNVILGSVIRQFGIKKDSNAHIFEISYFGLTNIYVQFEHPIEQSLATMEIDLKDITQVKCKLYASHSATNNNNKSNISLNSICNDDYITKVMQKSLSIPVTMRSIINKCKEAQAKLKENLIEKEKPPNSLSIPSSTNNVANGTSTLSSPNIFYQNTQQSQNNSKNNTQTQNKPLFTSFKTESSNSSSSNVPHTITTEQQATTPQSTSPQKNLQYIFFQQQQQQNLNKNSNIIQQKQFLNKYQSSSSSSSSSPSPNPSFVKSSSNNTMLMSMLSDVPALGVSPSSTNLSKPGTTKKRKRQSTENGSDHMGELPIVNKQRKTILLDDKHQVKQEPMDEYSLPGSNASLDSDKNEHYSVKSSGDGFNEQLKIIKSLEEISGQKDNVSNNTSGLTSDVPKLILKNEKFSNVKLTGRITSAANPQIKKERKRKRTDSLENKEFSLAGSTSESLLSGAQSSTSLAASTSTTKSGQSRVFFGTTSNNLTGSIQSNKSKKVNLSPSNISSNSGIGQSSLSSSSISSANYSNRANIQSIGGNTAMKINDKVFSILNKSNLLSSNNNNNNNNSNGSNSSTIQSKPQQTSTASSSSSLSSMLSSSKMSDLEHAAAMAVAANSGGSAAMAHAAAMAVVQNSLNETSKRFSKPTVKKSNSNQAIMVQNSAGSGSKSPITITVSSSPGSSGSQSLIVSMTNTSRKSELNKQQQISSSGSSVLAAPKQSSQQTSKTLSSNSSLFGSQSKMLQQQSSSLLSPSVQSVNPSSTSAASLKTGKTTKKCLSTVLQKLKSVADGSSSSTSSSAQSSSGLLSSTLPELGLSSNSNTISRVDSSSGSTTQKGSRQSDFKSKFHPQFTIKQSNSGLKMSITKNKASGGGSSSATSNSQSMLNTSNSAVDIISKLGASMFKNNKYTIPKIQKTSTASSVSSSSITSTVSSSTSNSLSSITSPTLSSSTSPPNSGRRNSQNLSSINSGKILPSPNHLSRMSTKNQSSMGNNNKSLFKSPELPAPLQPMPMLSYTTKSSSLSPVINNNNSNNNRSMTQSSFKSGSYSPVPTSNTGINWPSSSQDKTPGSTILIGSSNNPDALLTSCSSMMDSRLVSSSTTEQKTLSTSTPSSPAELSPISIENRSLPLIIPTEAISDQDNSNNNKSTIAKEVDSLKGNDFAEGSTVTSSFDQIKNSSSSVPNLNELMNKYPAIIQSGSGIKDITDSSPLSPPAIPSSTSNNLPDDNITAAIASSHESLSST